MKELIVNKKYDGKKLNSFLMDSFNGLSLNLLYKTLRKKDIRVNGTKISENIIVHVGDNIQVYISDEQLNNKPAFKITSADIVFEDENIVVVNKPVGIEVVGDFSLTSALNYYYKNLQSNNTQLQSSFKNLNACHIVSPCHRLDRNTTGLVLFAKNDTALKILLDKFKNHEIEKHYRAMVVGMLSQKKATLNAYLFKDSKKSLVYISDTPKRGYDKIITSYEVLNFDEKKNISLLDVTLHTGKTHQIRAHLAHIGHPIVGDGKYGNNEINKKLGFKTQQLCSYSLKFCFKLDSGMLNYLNGKLITLNNKIS